MRISSRPGGGGGGQVGIGAGFDNKCKKNKFICKHFWEATGGGLQIEKKEKKFGKSAFLVIFAWMNLLRRRQWRGGAGKARN